MTTATFPALTEVSEKLAAKQKQLHDLFAEAGPELDFSKVKSVKGDTFEIASIVRTWNEELDDLGQKRDDLAVVQKAAERTREAGSGEKGGRRQGEPGTDVATQGGGNGPAQKSFSELFTASDAYRQKSGAIGPESHIDVDLKTLMTTTTGWVPEVTRTGTLVPFATRPLQVADLVPQGQTSQGSVQYMEETTFTNAAAEVAEGLTYPEAALALTERLVPVQKISVFLPVTDEQLDDEPRMRTYLDNRLPFMIRQRLDLQLLVGNGTAPNLRGFLLTAGIQTQALGADPGPDAVYKAIVKVETIGQAIASGVIMNPTNWQAFRLLRTADGIYIWGNPSDTGPERIWGLTVARAQAETLGTALVGDFQNFSELVIRRGIDVQISNSHADFFINGKQAIRADMRAALVVYRPTAFCTVTGLA